MNKKSTRTSVSTSVQKLLSTLARKSAIDGAGKASHFGFYQPKVPIIVTK